MKSAFLTWSAVATLAASALAARPIDGTTESRWRAQPQWTPGKAADAYQVGNKRGWLSFGLCGAGKMMTWTLTPRPEELAGEPRYLVLRYRTLHLDPGRASYLLVVRDGSPGWVHYLNGPQLIADGQEHALAVDMLSFRPPQPISQMALRIGPHTDDQQYGKLIAKIEFCDQPPAGVELVKKQWPEPEKTRVEIEEVEWRPSANWTPRPPDEHSMDKTAAGVRYAMRGQHRSMRWSAKLPSAIDVGRLPFVSIRYRGKGEFGPHGYAFYAAVYQGEKKSSAQFMEPGDVDGDGQWRVHHVRVAVKGEIGKSVAVGIDCLSPEAEIEIDYLEFANVPPETPLADVLASELRPQAWPANRGGFTTVPLPRGKRPNAFMLPRMGIGKWLGSPEITIDGVPFSAPASPASMPCTSMVGDDSLSVTLPAQANEVLLLVAASFPTGEPFGSNWRKPSPLRLLSEPERLAVELAYADGSAEEMLPVRASSVEYGVGHGVAMYAVRPAAGKHATSLALHDRLHNASFGIMGVTLNHGAPRVPEPTLHHAWYPAVARLRPAPASIGINAEQGFTWGRIESSLLHLDLSGQPIFRLKLGDREITSAQFKVSEANRTADGMAATGVFADQALSLEAKLTTQHVGDAGIQVALELTNSGNTPATGTLFFPTASGVVLGSVRDTWYFCTRRGGVVNRVPCRFRDEIGENHPLQVDGFFSPSAGAGVCFMPRDPSDTFRWYNVAKDEAGGSYALEFLPQTVDPGKSWSSIPTVVAVVPGDWRDQFKAYLAWVQTWYKPTAPRKQWFREVFSFATGAPYQSSGMTLDQQVDFAGLAKQKDREIPGSADYLHLFGWAKTKKYGHWGDYDHFHEIGGQERFTQEVKRCQDSGVPLGLYLDCYLVATKSVKPLQPQRQAWAVRKSDGKMLYHTSYDAHSMCPYVKGWRDYLTAVYARLSREVKPSGLYLDEFGKCMVSRTCHGTAHGHPSPMGMSPGEGDLAKQIREAVDPGIATYCEYVPGDVMSQHLDGAFGHVALKGHREGYDRIAGHYVNLQRFAFPTFKTFELIYYVPWRNGNWFLLKYPFFNGDGYYLTSSSVRDPDDRAREFIANVFRVQHAHRDAFSSADVEPLVRTEAPGLYANRFRTPAKTVWTLFNASYRTLRGPLLRVAHRQGTAYHDAWNGRPVEAQVQADRATLTIDIGPRAVGCVVQARP